MNTAEYIAQIPLFEGLPKEQIRNLAGIAVMRSYQKGQTIFAEGDDGTGFYVVVSARVKVFKLSPEGKEQTLHIFGPGEPFGEVAVLSGRSFPASAEASSGGTVLFFPRDGFVRLIKDDSSLALNMLAVLSERLRRFSRLIEDLSLKEVPGRLAAYLLYLDSRDSAVPHIDLDIKKGQLASLLGTIPETLSRILTKMNQEGLIVTEGPRITILDRPALEEIARGEKKPFSGSQS